MCFFYFVYRSLLGISDGESLIGSDAYRKLQTELSESRRETQTHSKTCNRLREDQSREAVYRREVEEKWNEKADAHKAETEALNKQVSNKLNLPCKWKLTKI
jgi:hypothetical protein